MEVLNLDVEEFRTIFGVLGELGERGDEDLTFPGHAGEAKSVEDGVAPAGGLRVGRGHAGSLPP